MIRTALLTLGAAAGLALTSGNASAQFFSPPGYNPYAGLNVVPSTYYTTPTYVTPATYVSPVYRSYYYSPRVVYPAAPVYRGVYPTYGWSYRTGPVYRSGWRGWRR